ncbi:MAG: C39 family peptidase [Acidobacteria bacterium]|nr:C39 family peptidase [Acidobacteriota bacterium]
MPLRIKDGVNIPVARFTAPELLSGLRSARLALPEELLVLPTNIPFIPGEQSARIDVRPVHQAEELWCWAACAEMVLRFFGVARDECTVAGDHLKRDCCNPFGPGCNVGLSVEGVDQAFATAGLAGNRFPSALSFDEIKEQISGAIPRPIVAGIKWASGNGHLIVISGWREAGARRFVTVNDPFYNSGDIRYESLVSNYGPNNTGRWENTWTEFRRA